MYQVSRVIRAVPQLTEGELADQCFYDALTVSNGTTQDEELCLRGVLCDLSPIYGFVRGLLNSKPLSMLNTVPTYGTRTGVVACSVFSNVVELLNAYTVISSR